MLKGRVPATVAMLALAAVGSATVAGAAIQPRRIAELDPPGRDGIAVGRGVWETSGITDTSGLFGGGSWIFDVQAHSPTTAPGVNTWEDGQLLLLTRADDDDDDDDDD
jgi:hypothetical protein